MPRIPLENVCLQTSFQYGVSPGCGKLTVLEADIGRPGQMYPWQANAVVTSNYNLLSVKVSSATGFII
jgi:hypothetical protein